MLCWLQSPCSISAGLLPTLEKFGKTCQLLLGPDNLHFIQASQDTDGMQITASWAVVRFHLAKPHSNPNGLSHFNLQSVLFEPETYRTISKKDNLIAFVFEIPLLLRVLKAAGNNAADSLEVKLAMRTLSTGPSTQPVSRPYLTFASKGHNLNMTQDLPVSKPYTAGRKSMLFRDSSLPLPKLTPLRMMQLMCPHAPVFTLLEQHSTAVPLLSAEIDELNGIKDVTQLCLFYIDLQGEVQRLQVSLQIEG